MDASVAKDLISNVGFPIACCVGLIFGFKYIIDHFTALIKEIIASHKAESDKFAEALDKNTVVLERIYERLNN